MKIGELSIKSGVSIRMLRYYEERGLLTPKRTASGYRDYDEEELRTLERIKLLASAGMNLNTILVFLPCIRGDQHVFEPCDELIDLLHDQIKMVNEEVAKLSHSKTVLEHFLYDIENTK
ncbi:hypothetical protein N480_05655 [Pseudoalteromonas luteoviolacea S2607]|uniref:MerR family transcriptional regulator n=1 Tax=Pseudoalteromonas luteoviolacea TaxID=43657 RepID=UPI0007B0BAA0|nr:MerR family transcriptional regulator [Pseudoalteromonas luteoviolacea]KZN30438.1 hypothetical protein N480_05655 [Pseudoalteromonas luteoviolacea S2607]